MHRDFIDSTIQGKKIFKVEYKLILFGIYTAVLFFILFWKHQWEIVFYVHISFVLLFSIFYFGRQFLYIFFAPIIPFAIYLEHNRVKRYLHKVKVNVPAEAVIILGHADWTTLEAWIKPIASSKEIKTLIKYLKVKKQDFSFYPQAEIIDVKKIMADKEIKEVYFWGHGSSHVFQLSTNEILYYCEFAGGKYSKEFVHQVHCGTSHGKSLIDYVVRSENRPKCFLVRKPITGDFIIKEFKHKIKAL